MTHRPASPTQLSPLRRGVTAGIALALAAFLLAAGPALAAGGAEAAPLSVPLYAPPATAQPALARIAPPLRLVDVAHPAPMVSMPASAEAAGDQLAALRAWNEAGHKPYRVGIVRPLPAPHAVHLRGAGAGLTAGAEPRAADGGVAVRTADGRLVWGGEVTVADAGRVRLHLSDVRLPAGARLWLYAADGSTVGPFGLELLSDDGLWTPSLGSGSARLEVEIPAAAGDGDWGFAVDRVADVLATEETAALVAGAAAPKLGSVTAALDESCITDVSCISSATFPVVEPVKRAIAQLQFVVGPFIGVCTGSLLNNTQADGTPYLLTANHCISTQQEASSLEAFWDFYTSSCNGPLPNPNTLPMSSGATLLTTGTSSDFTLLELDSLPTNRVFLGWNANAIPNNMVLHRVHHPLPGNTPLGQSYTRLRYLASNFNQCGSSNQGQQFDNPSFFHHGELLQGGEFSGSSGSPLMNGEGQVVGQLFGSCGPAPEEGCDDRNHSLDGAFSASFQSLRPFLAPVVSGPCVPDATTLCLNNDRFRVEVDWATPQGTSGSGQVVQGVSSDTSGLFYFFNQNNWEMLIKVLNGCPVNDHYWVFFAATTNVEFTVTVTDTQENETALYTNPLNHPANAVTDTNAFATCP